MTFNSGYDTLIYSSIKKQKHDRKRIFGKVRIGKSSV